MLGGEVDEDGGVRDVGEEEGEGEGDGEHRLLEAAPTAHVAQDILEILDRLLLLFFAALGTARRLFHCDVDQFVLMAKLDPFLSLDCARVEGVGAQPKERNGSNFAA